MKPKTIIFDFDGTIADTFLLVISIFYRLKPRLFIFPKKEVERLRGMALLEVARQLDVSFWQVPVLLFRGRKMMAREMKNVQLIRGMEKVIADLHADGHILYIVSSNSEANIRTLLKKYNLEHYFTAVHGSSRLHGKKSIIRKVQRETGRQTIYVGDEIRDIMSARAAGVGIVSVSWGYNNIHILKEHQPDIIVFDPADITKYIRKLA